MIKRFTLYAVAFSLSFSVFAQDNVDQSAVQKIRKEGLENSKVMELAFQMTDVAGPRLSNSPGLRRAQDWAVKEFKSWGLSNVQLEPWGTFGKGWQVEKNYVATTKPFYRSLIASPKAWTPGTNGPIKSEVVLIKISDVKDLEQYKGKLSGKIVLVDQAVALKTTFKADAVRYTDAELLDMANAQLTQPAAAPAAANTAAATEAREAMMRLRQLRGAIASTLAQENVGLILTYARGGHGTLFTSNGASYALDAKMAAPELEVAAEDYLRMLRLLRANIAVEVEADIKTSFFTEDPQGYNVIAEIPGTDPKLKDEVVMLGAHYDSWHAGTGATDNASGSSVMMEAMRILKASGFKPKRTIRVALWSSEEQGLHGSRNYVTKHFGDRSTMKLLPAHQKVAAYYNLDNGTGRIRGIYAQGNEAVVPIFKSWLQPFHDLDATTVTLRNTGSTDHMAFDAVGIPGFQFIQDPIDYSTRTHHSNQDTFERLIESDLKQAATIIASFVYHTSERASLMPRKALPKAVAPAAR